MSIPPVRTRASVAVALLLLACVGASDVAAAPGPATAKATVSCEVSVGAAGVTFAGVTAKSLKRCVDAVFACVQLKPLDDRCIAKATGTCDKQYARIDAGTTKLQRAIDKRCDESAVPFATLSAPDGGDFAGLSDECAAYGASVLTLPDYRECLRRQHTCAAEQLIRFAIPRATELLALVGRELPSAFCPVPTPSPTPTGPGTPGGATNTPQASATTTPQASPTSTPQSSPTTTTSTGGGTPTATNTTVPSVTPTPPPGPTPTVTPGPFNLVFVTSTTQPANLGGATAYDTVCQTRAVAAGLPGTYVAWVSDASANAVTRLGTARGFVRIDGEPFADTLAALASNQVWHSVSLDEHGVDVGVASTWTGTLADGTASGTCTHWTSLSGSGVTGQATGGPVSWTAHGSDPCSDSRRIYCFGKDRTAALVPTPMSGRIAFVTAIGFNPTSGLAAADALCADQASAAGRSGSYKALLATTTATAASRFDLLATPYVRPDGIEIATDAVIAAGGTLASGIWQNASGTYVASASTTVWTGAATPSSLGTAASTCNDWSASTSMVGTIGASTLADASWWNVATLACTSARKIFCLQE
jgi:hypothetical protein